MPSQPSSDKHVSHPFPVDPASLPKWEEISSLSNQELINLFNASGNEYALASQTRPTNVRRIASDAVMKVNSCFSEPDSEPLTMSLVRQQTSILVPAVKRQFTYQDQANIFVMDFIPGQSLTDSWHSLSLLRRVFIVFTLRRYIRELRRVEFPGVPRSKQFPGRIGPEPRPCFGPMFSIYGDGPFATYDNLTSWFMHKLDVNRQIRKTPEKDMTFDSSLPLVLTHLDIHPNNIIIDPAYRVWLIDWEHAGFYPQCFEFCSMDIGWTILGRWRRQILGFMAGFYQRQTLFINSIGWNPYRGILITLLTG